MYAIICLPYMANESAGNGEMCWRAGSSYIKTNIDIKIIMKFEAVYDNYLYKRKHNAAFAIFTIA